MAGTSGQSWESFVAQNPNIANVPGAQASFQKGVQTVQNQINTAGMKGQTWTDYSKQNPQAASIPGAQQQFQQGQQYASTVLSKNFPKPQTTISPQDPKYSAYYAALAGISWNDFSKYGSVANSPFPIEIPGGSPQSKVVGAQAAYEMGKQYASQANQYLSTSAYGAGIAGQTWDTYIKNNPNAVNVPGAQDLYNQGVNYIKNLPRGSNPQNTGGGGVAVAGGFVASILPIILGFLL